MVLVMFRFMSLTQAGHEEFYKDRGCFRDCDDLLTGYEECSAACSTEYSRLKVAHQKAPEPEIVKPTEQIVEVTPETFKSTIKETSGEETKEIKQIECDTVDEGVKSCSIEGYPHFTVSASANVVEREGDIIVTAPEGEDAILTYDSGYKIFLKGEYVPLRILGEISFGGKVKAFFEDLGKSKNKVQTIKDWFSRKKILSPPGGAQTVVRG